MLSRNTIIPSLLLLLSGCASTGTDKAAYTATAMREVQTELGKGVQDVDAVVQSMNQLAEAGGNMSQEYQAYSRAVDTMEDQAERIRGLRTDMEAREAAFMQDWDNRLTQIRDADLRQRASERRDQAVQRFDELGTKADAARDVFQPWMQSLTDIRTYLQNDLNPTGVESLSDVFDSVNDGAEEIKEQVQGLVSELDTMITAIEAAVPPPPETGTDSSR